MFTFVSVFVFHYFCIKYRLTLTVRMKFRNCVAWIFCLLILLGESCVRVCASDIRWKNLSIEDGLSNLNVNGIIQDVNGYMWIATMRGLNRYDGYSFQCYEFIPGDSTSIRSNHINALCFWNDRYLLLGSNEGVDCFDIRTEKSIPLNIGSHSVGVLSLVGTSDAVYAGAVDGLYRLDKKGEYPQFFSPTALKGEYITHTFLADNGDVWCALARSSYFVRYIPTSDRIEYYSLPTSSSQHIVQSIQQDDYGRIILATTYGLYFYDYMQQCYVEPEEWKPCLARMRTQDVSFVMKRDDDVYWISNKNGFFSYDLKDRQLKQIYWMNRSDNTFRCYYSDVDGNMWLGSFDLGISVEYNNYHPFNYDKILNKITSDNFIMAISEDRDGNLLLGFRNEYFYICSPEGRTDRLRLPVSYETRIRTLFVDSNNCYWIGHNYGSILYDPASKSFRSLETPDYCGGVTSFVQFQGRIYAGTSSTGVLEYDLRGNLLHQATDYGTNIPEIIVCDENSLLFSSYGNGIYRYWPKKRLVTKFETEDPDVNMGLNYVITLFSDSSYVWAGTYNYGLYRLSLGTSRVANFRKQEGLPSNDVVGICPGRGSSLWLSTSLGLACFDRASSGVTALYSGEMVGVYQFHQNAVLLAADSTAYFGGSNGMAYFSLQNEELYAVKEPRIQLEKIEIAEVNGQKNYFPKPDQTVIFTHRDRFINFRYIAIDYATASEMTYYYRLEGFDPSWQEAGTRRNVSYSNLARGKYTFRIKARNSNGVWSGNEIAIPIRVKPAPWFSAVAWVLYVVLFILGGVFLIEFYIRSKLYRAQLVQEQYNHAREQELEQMKRRFFTNIAHEFRTPLTLISIMSERLRKIDLPGEVYHKIVSHLDYNVKRMLRLTNQLLSFKHMKGETLPLWVSHLCLNDEMETLLLSMKAFAEDKSIVLESRFEDRFEFTYDHDKVEKITGNLITNAIKHTAAGGRINVQIRLIPFEEAISHYPHTSSFGKEMHTDHYVEILVADTGEGIPAAVLPHIFERYVHADSPLSEDWGSSGIGLHFSRSLVELHKGSIRVESQQGKGSRFSYILPYESDIYSHEEFGVDALQDQVTLSKEQTTDTVFEGNDKVKEYLEAKKQMENEASVAGTVLVIEDNIELNRVLCEMLSERYRVLSVCDGEAGYELTKKELPDLILSDVMLPKMSGVTLTRRLKSNRKYSYIPIVLMSAKSELQDQLDGMEVGADFYLPKPFQSEYLLKLIHNLLENRERLKNVFMNGLMPSLEKQATSQTDIQFISRLNEVIETHILNRNLDVPFIARQMGMSRSSLYRSFVEVMNMTPNVYIKKLKINKAVELMKQQKYSLREIVDMTGFGSTTYFSTVFKAEKQMSPSEFIANLKKNKSTFKSSNSSETTD